MQWKQGLAIVLALGLASSAFAAGSSSPARKPAPPDNYDLAVKAVKAKNFERAIGLLQMVVKKKPGDADAWNWLGFSYRKLKNFDQAVPAYQKALTIKPDHRGANEYLGELYLQIGDLVKAKQRLKKLDKVCFFGCEEYDDLKAAIEAHEAGKTPG